MLHAFGSIVHQLQNNATKRLPPKCRSVVVYDLGNSHQRSQHSHSKWWIVVDLLDWSCDAPWTNRLVSEISQIRLRMTLLRYNG